MMVSVSNLNFIQLWWHVTDYKNRFKMNDR